MSDVPDIQLDNPDEIRWFEGRGPAPVLGPCPHNCERHRHSLIAWGPTTDRYKLVECSGYPTSECDGRCRAWLDGWGNEVTAWLMVDVDPAEVAWSTRLARRASRPNPGGEGVR